MCPRRRLGPRGRRAAPAGSRDRRRRRGRPRPAYAHRSPTSASSTSSPSGCGAAADALTPGWLGGQLDARFEDTPLGGPTLPGVRPDRHRAAARRRPVPGDRAAARHRAPDRRRRRPRPAGRPACCGPYCCGLLAAAPAGLAAGARGRRGRRRHGVRAVRRARRRGLMPPPVTDRTGLRAVLAEAEQWVRPARPAARPAHPPRPHAAGRHRVAARADRGRRPGPDRARSRSTGPTPACT